MVLEANGLLPAAKFALPVLLTLAAVYDHRQRRIPNALSLVGMGAGLLVGLYFGGITGLSHSFLGLLAGGGIFLPFYMIRAMGAGDVKLMAAAGSFLGPWHTLLASIAVALLGGVFAALAAFRQGRLGPALRDAVGALVRVKPIKTLDSSSRDDAIPYGLAIAAGVLLYLLVLNYVP